MLRFYILLALPAYLFLGCGSYDEVRSFYAEKCGDDYYDLDIQFCQNAKVYNKCGGYIYDPLNQKCENNSLSSKCGDEWYNPFSEFCTSDGNVIENKGEFIDSRDSKTYRYVIIGTQTWMAENLQYETSNTKCYDNNPDNCKIFGILYDWNTAKTICPSGWHLPNDDEWITLRDYVNSDEAKLKANSSTWKFSKGTDDFGFTALPGGFYRGDIGGFNYNGECAGFWSATEGRISGSAHLRYINNNSFGLDGLYINNSWVNVRCLKSAP